ncbi:MAG: KEOPS complex N(6)-L-threonylcarbamoyladenine synthase Kae1, partial [Candidatus Micrarchaeota archaeon]|nr:KEOPS complex N(6)-L-threonylcarbamoyladenine synthase Kae1 [Candidatus Micrarchaeota archaeon]
SVYMPKFTGIHPRKAADFHSENFEGVLSKALASAKISPPQIDLIAFSQGPGLAACLKVGVVGAKSLALLLGKPIIGVNHCIAHIEISKLFTKTKDPLVVYVSGGNTQIIIKGKDRRYRVLGETLDIGLGNLIDTFGRAMGLERAHGGVIEQMAKGGKYVPLPYVVKGMDLSFTGLLTNLTRKLESKQYPHKDLCYSMQETAFSMLTEASERALALTGKRELIVCGGCAQNARLQEMLTLMAGEHKAKFGVAPGQYNADNGAMIAYTGLYLYKRGHRMKLSEAKSIQRFRTDEVRI